MSKAGNTFGKVMIWLLAIIIMIVIVGAVLYFTLRGEGATYFVQYGSETYYVNSANAELSLQTDIPQEFAVKSLTGGNVGYTVKVVANEANNFRFSFGDELHSLYSGNDGLDDYSDLFALQKNGDGFCISVPSRTSVEDFIETKYGGDVVIIDELSENMAYFSIVVSFENGSINIPFSFDGQIQIFVEDITVNPPSIVF